jgi:hypothetical protein
LPLGSSVCHRDVLGSSSLTTVLLAGVVTENQFVCGLSLACSAHNAAHLSRDEIQTLVGEFADADGHVRYREFCQLTDSGQCPFLPYFAPDSLELIKSINFFVDRRCECTCN